MSTVGLSQEGQGVESRIGERMTLSIGKEIQEEKKTNPVRVRTTRTYTKEICDVKKVTPHKKSWRGHFLSSITND